MKKIAVDKGVSFGGGELTFIAGPCVIESRAMAMDLAKRLSALARKLGMSSLKGHRSVGGLRASIYNAFPMEGVDALVSFMKDFEKKNG